MPPRQIPVPLTPALPGRRTHWQTPERASALRRRPSSVRTDDAWFIAIRGWFSADGPASMPKRTANNCGGCGVACFSGATCQNGSCSCAASGRTYCNGVCVDTQSNGANCGACASPCPVGAACIAGECAVTCPSGMNWCAGTSCVDLTSTKDHCGLCDQVCGGSLVCLSGQCACPSGLTDCSGNCVDVNTDGQDCGGCAVVCANSQTCVNGVCQ